ncbi:hypothetical protein FPOA_03467 [Fusarium poae]|uniref:Uncharacterized protein n=1 Tax=Fusarium poae TaxID=36050 RepID=A0A1B8B9X1_FUSPO|nr:hypothetical protein FPOA_03467 [Fusarium poae]
MDSTASPSEVAQLAPKRPPEAWEIQWEYHKKLAHFYHSSDCIYCDGPVATPIYATPGYCDDPQDPFPNKRPSALLYCKDPHIGTWKLIWEISRDMDLSKYENEGVCWCNPWTTDPVNTGGLLTFHKKCFVAINGPDLSAERMDRLGRAMFWTNIKHLDIPHPNSYYFARTLDSQDYRHDSISSMGQKIGLPLGRLPLETLQHIQSHCHDHPFWKMVKNLDFATCLDLGPRTKMLSVSLASVVQWTRGSNSPVLSSREASSGRFRIMIDMQGFGKIERLSEYPRVCLRKRPFKRFIIVEAHHATKIDASFKDGMCWLGLRNAESISTIWDTPTPPAGLLSCILRSQKHVCHVSSENCSLMISGHSGNAFETADLDAIGGLSMTFFCRSNIVMKAYSKPAPLRQLRELDPWGGAVYMPLASNDRILWMQVRQYSDNDPYLGILVKTELSGIIHLGKKGTGPSKIIAFSESPRAIFHSPGYGNSLEAVVAIDPKSHPSPDHEASKLVNIGPPIPNIYSSAPMWSWAPLQDIATVHVFVTTDKGHFVGMHITYNNGGQRFVGDPNASAPDQSFRIPPKEVRVENPTRLYVETKVHWERSQRVVFSVGESDEFERDPTWKKYEITGKSDFWEFHLWYEPRNLPPYKYKVQVLTSGSWRG